MIETALDAIRYDKTITNQHKKKTQVQEDINLLIVKFKKSGLTKHDKYIVITRIRKTFKKRFIFF